MPQRKRVLITGANGFTGRHLSALLSPDPATELFFADRNAQKRPDLRLHVCDFSDADAVKKLLRTVRPAALYHLIGSYSNDYDTDYTSNVLTAKHILDGLHALKMSCRVLLVGSSAEYGFPDNPKRAIPETHPLRPVSVYGLAKVYLTKLMEFSVRMYGMNIVAVRPFNLLGEGISPRLFPGKMAQEIARCKRGEIRKIVTGALSVERDYIDIAEAIKYYRRVMERGKMGEVYNVGSGKSTSLRELLVHLLGKEGLSFDCVREGTHTVPGKIVVPKIFADISKIKQLT